jgi:four helix bundle protein
LIDFKSLQIWKRSHLFALSVYKITRKFPKDEMYGLTSQLRRASVSVPSNIVEGCGRNSDGELSRFLTIAMGSAAETEYQILLAKDLKYIENDEYLLLDKEIIEIRKMINKFLEKVNSRRENRK